MSGKTLELTVRSQSAIMDLVERGQRRLAQQRGQTAAEYLGVLVVVAVIIAAVAGSGIGGKISGFVGEQIDKINGSGDVG